MSRVIAIANQSLFDIANQEFGSIDAAFPIAVLNGWPVTHLPTPGQFVELPDLVIERDIAEYFKNNNISIATAVEPRVLDEVYSFPGDFPFSF